MEYFGFNYDNWKTACCDKYPNCADCPCEQEFDDEPEPSVEIYKLTWKGGTYGERFEYSEIYSNKAVAKHYFRNVYRDVTRKLKSEIDEINMFDRYHTDVAEISFFKLETLVSDNGIFKVVSTEKYVKEETWNHYN